MRRSRFSRARNGDVLGSMDVVNVWMMLDAEVVVDGRPARVLRIVSFGEVVELEVDDDGSKDTKVNAGYVVIARVPDTMGPSSAR